MTIERPRRRARRIAADEAHAWARNLRLKNPYAKLVLSMLTLYVDPDGTCFVSIPTLSEDTELSAQTVRDRLAFLEEAGAIKRIEQWEDRKGNRNGDGEGRRTSDLIVLMIDRDERDLESNAAAIVARKQTPPIHQIGGPPLSAGQGDPPVHGVGGDSAGTPLPLRRPYDSAEGLISEPEPEPESPQPPEGGESEDVEDLEPEDFPPAWQSWPGHEIMRRDLALAEFRLLPLEKQRLCRAAISHFVRMQQHLKRDHYPNFHIWIRHRGFDEFPGAALDPVSGAAPPAVTTFDENTREGGAIKALFKFARMPLFVNRGQVVYPLPMTARVLAFADAGDQSAWQWIEDNAQIIAWSSFLSKHIHRAGIAPVRTRGIGAEMRRGMYAPWPWPPRKNGATDADSADDETGDAA